MSNKRNNSLDALKGVAIVLVMFGHILVWNEIEDAYIYNMIKAIQMPLFIVISGYLMAFKPPVNTFERAILIIKRRAITYLLPFFSWLVLKYWRDLGWGLKNVLFNLDRGLWFLMTIFILSVTLIISQAIAMKCKTKFLQEILFWIVEIVFLGLFFAQSRVGNSFLSPNLTVFYAPFFLGGYFLKHYEKELVNIFGVFAKRELLKVEGAIALIIWLVLSISFDFSGNSDIITVLMQLVAGGVGSIGLLTLFLQSKENQLTKKLSFIGKYTLEIYVLHFHFATILNRGITYNVWYESWKSMVFTMLSFVAMTLITVIIIVVVKKYIPILDLLLFGKIQNHRVNKKIK